MKKEAVNFKESRQDYMGGYGGRKEKGEIFKL